MFYIFDCNDNIVGNPKGYRTIRGAQAQTNNHRSKIYCDLWAAFEAQSARDPIGYIRIFSIRMLGDE